MIENKRVRIQRAGTAEAELPDAISEAVGKGALRWHIAQASDDALLSYMEAAGAVMALRKGISLASLVRPLKAIRY